MAKLLCMSNGHGEDAIAVRILDALRQLPDGPELAALPLVGEGQAYQKAGIALYGTTKVLPSGGFIYMDSRQLARDVQGGLVPLIRAQIQAVQDWAKAGGAIFAVGDVIPLGMAKLSGAPFSFLGTAKSDYWLRDEAGVLPGRPWYEGWAGSVYLPWERWLMRSRTCQAVFVRDQLTADRLRPFGIAAEYLGNPMMDGLTPNEEKLNQLQAELPDAAVTLALLPGSRAPEAYRNWERIRVAIEQVRSQAGDQPVRFLGAIVPSLDLSPFQQGLMADGWLPLPADYPTFRKGNGHLRLTQDGFNECLQLATGAIAMAGTATEQLVGLGKPVATFAGEGPQFTRAFAQAQSRLLGPSVLLVDRPETAGDVLWSCLHNADQLAAIRENGYRRMGDPGGAAQIAQRLRDLGKNQA